MPENRVGGQPVGSPNPSRPTGGGAGERVDCYLPTPRQQRRDAVLLYHLGSKAEAYSGVVQTTLEYRNGSAQPETHAGVASAYRQNRNHGDQKAANGRLRL